MSARWNVITGATGLLGSHIAELLVRRGERVRALARVSSDVTFLKGLGVECVEADLRDAARVRRQIDGADAVYHCAGRVSDWGEWSLYQEHVIGITCALARASAGAVGRLLHVSSVAVYGRLRATAGRRFGEEEPTGQRLSVFRDYYARAKIEAERVVRRFCPEATVVRPGWIYGPRDRNFLPRLFAMLRSGAVALIGSGDNPLGLVYAADVARGAVLAAGHPGAAGQAYNLAGDNAISQREFLNAFADALGTPRVRRRVPLAVAYGGALLSEFVGFLIRIRRSPHITRYAVRLLTRCYDYSSDKARLQLGWRPEVSARAGIEHTLAWAKGAGL
jgi:nucleoside-diphosphate-sugar epimerase